MRLQTTGAGTNSVLAQGLNSVMFMADVSERKFKQALEKKLSEMKPAKKSKAEKQH